MANDIAVKIKGIPMDAFLISPILISLNAGIIFFKPNDNTTKVAAMSIAVNAWNIPIGIMVDNIQEDAAILKDSAIKITGIIPVAANAATGSTPLNADIILPIPNAKTVKTPAISIAVIA